MRIGPEQARARVEARLGRPPQDAIEAAIVLEAWGGLPTSHALELGTAVAATPRPDAPRRPPSRGERPERAAAGRARDPLALAAAILITTTWLMTLGRAFGASATHLALEIALPGSVGLQWFLGRRYIGNGQGVGGMRPDWRWILGSTLAGLGALGVLGWGGLLAGGLTMIWVSLVILLKRGWGLPYAGVLAAVTVALALHPPAWVALVLLCGLPLTAAGVAIGTAPATEHRPGPWRLAAAAGLAGAVVGETFVLGVNQPSGLGWQVSLLALAPIVVGALWAADHLSRIWDLIREPVPRFTRSSRQGDAVDGRGSRRLAGHILLGALLRLSAGAAGLAVIGAAVSHRSQVNVPETVFTYVGIGIVALVVALLEGFGHRTWALLVAAGACAPMLVAQLGLVDLGSGGQPAMLASAIGILACLVACSSFLKDPQRALVVANL